MPSFFMGSLVTQLRAAWGVDAAAIGWAAASLFVTAALLAPTGAWISRRFGSNVALVIAPALSLITYVLGATAQSFPWLVTALVIGGAANAVAQPVSSIRLAEHVDLTRLSFAFGLKQAAIPSAALVAGLAVPTIALTAGWRWVWVAGALAALVTSLYGFRHRSRTPPGNMLVVSDDPAGRTRLSRRTMLLLTAGGFLAAAVGTAVGVFFVDSAVATGYGSGTAGMLYAIFSAIAVCTRIFLGWYSDRHSGIDSYLLAASLLAVGVIGNVVFALPLGWTVFAGALLSYVLGWAWPGLMQWSVSRDNRASLHAATGMFQSGCSLGAGVGPIVFGAIVAGGSFQVGWLCAAGIGFAAAALVLMGGLSARRE